MHTPDNLQPGITVKGEDLDHIIEFLRSIHIYSDNETITANHDSGGINIRINDQYGFSGGGGSGETIQFTFPCEITSSEGNGIYKGNLLESDWATVKETGVTVIPAPRVAIQDTALVGGKTLVELIPTTTLGGG